jgi:hypothetical protein
MKKLLSLCAGMLVMLTAVSPMNAAEEKVALEKVPKVVIDTVKKRFPKAELVEAAKETDGTKIEYEISLKDGETKYDVMLTPEGKITLIEKVISAKDLPKVVAAALEEKYPKATYKVYEEMTKVIDGKEVLAYYEVLLETTDKKTLEVEVSPEGKILAEEKK